MECHSPPHFNLLPSTTKQHQCIVLRCQQAVGRAVKLGDDRLGERVERKFRLNGKIEDKATIDPCATATRYGVLCDPLFANVESFDLTGRALAGAMPHSIGNLTNL
ncbi:Uncharacterized protein Fot_31413 [Forsythia ovata]|uniref:Uncharacterized protein n=1 Tax=Forsythia ovata TaxID=205694 RepID=A0ABD1T4V8_9LAMI